MWASLSLLLAAATTVLGHGYVQEVTTSAGTYTGYLPFSDPYASPAPQRVVRRIAWDGPVQNLSLIDVQCGGWSENGVVGSAPAPLVAEAAAGTQVAFNWTEWSSSHIGPIITYMARAPSDIDITKWNPGTSAVWFKVAEDGLVNSQWPTWTLSANKSIYKFTIPSSLAPGQYLVRHEIIAVHAAGVYPGAQVYPSCLQVNVTGSGTKTGPSSLVSFPGEYTATTSGIRFYAFGATTYPIPGPAVWTG